MTSEETNGTQSLGLSAIQEEGLKLLAMPLRSDIVTRISLIQLTYPYGHDVRSVRSDSKNLTND